MTLRVFYLSIAGMIMLILPFSLRSAGENSIIMMGLGLFLLSFISLYVLVFVPKIKDKENMDMRKLYRNLFLLILGISCLYQVLFFLYD